MITDRLHGALAAYFDQYQLSTPLERIDGAVVLAVDGRYRIYCRPGPYGDVIFESALSDVPTNLREAEDFFRTTLMASMVRMATHADVPVLSSNEKVLLLQQRIPSDATLEEFEGSLENFINSLAEWRRIFRVL